MKEIGGYFELEHFEGTELYPDAVALNDARSALLFLFRSRKISKIWLPYYLCSSVRNLCIREQISYEQYHVGGDFLPQFQKNMGEDEYLYIVNYYGILTEEKERSLLENNKNVIFDHVQAFFQNPLPGSDTIYSCRKFFGVPDGGYLVTDSQIEEPLLPDESAKRFRHLLGRFECKHAIEYYEDFKHNDRALADAKLQAMSKLTHNLLRAINYQSVKKKREENYAVLDCLLRELNPIKLNPPPGPYAYPFYCEDGLNVKKQLAQKEIFVSTLWPNVAEDGNDLERSYAENILPLPCDQRYGAEEMQFLATTLLQLL